MYDLHGETVHFDTENNRLLLLDQTELPQKTVVLALRTREELFEAIQSLRVRGAPAIGVAAAIGLAVLANESRQTEIPAFCAEVRENAAHLKAARPTAVNLPWALGEMEKVLSNGAKTVEALKAALTSRALALHAADIEVCRRIGENGAPLLKNCRAVLTHCNAGRLAAVKYGTALAPIYTAKEQGHNIAVYADETRPLLQGARLTAYELHEAGIDVTVLCDSAASYVLGSGKVQAVLVGCDRVAANGDTANKVGTSGVAVLAQHYGIPFYVCAPFSTIDFSCASGADIPIEMRDDREIGTLWYQKKMLPDGVCALNPAFDVTSADLITAFITEKGVIEPKALAQYR